MVWIQWIAPAELLMQALDNETQMLDLSYHTLSPFDCYTICDCLRNSACQWRLNFSECNITETGMRMLSGTTGGSLNHVESIELSFNPVKTGGVYFGESNAVCLLFCAVSKSGWAAD